MLTAHVLSMIAHIPIPATILLTYAAYKHLWHTAIA